MECSLAFICWIVFFLLYGTETVPAMQKKYQLLNFTENKKKKQTNKSQPQIIFAFRIQNMVHYALNDLENLNLIKKYMSCDL